MTEFHNRLIELGMRPSAVSAYIGKTFPTPSCSDLGRIFKGVEKKVCFLFMSRVGSTFLSEKLNRTRVVGTIHEHMNIYHIARYCEQHKLTSIEAYLTHIVQETKTPNGVYAFKAQLEALVPWAQVAELPDHVQDWYWVTIHRRDRVSQAVSLARAKLTGRWHVGSGLQEQQKAEEERPEILFRHVLKNYENILSKEGANELFFRRNNIQPLRLCYEDFQDDQYNALRKIFVFLKIPAPDNLAELTLTDGFKPMRDTYSEDVAAAFRDKFL